MQDLTELDVHMPLTKLSARCPTRLHQQIDSELFASLSQGLVLGHQVPVWCVLGSQLSLEIDHCLPACLATECSVGLGGHSPSSGRGPEASLRAATHAAL